MSLSRPLVLLMLAAGVVLTLALHSAPGKALARRAVAEFQAHIETRYDPLQGGRLETEASDGRAPTHMEVSSC